jgi:hypothetical protein
MFKNVIPATGILICLLLTSCKSNTNENKINQVIKIPAHIEKYNPYMKNVDSLKDEPPLLIYTLVDVSCATCILKLEKWNTFFAEIKDNKKNLLSIRPVCFSKDHFETLKFLFESKQIAKIDFPLLLDINNKFISENSSLVKMGEMTALTNAGNEVLMTGNPIENAEDRKRFIEKINETSPKEEMQ